MAQLDHRAGAIVPHGTPAQCYPRPMTLNPRKRQRQGSNITSATLTEYMGAREARQGFQGSVTFGETPILKCFAIPHNVAWHWITPDFPISLKADGQCLRFRHIPSQSFARTIVIPPHTNSHPQIAGQFSFSTYLYRSNNACVAHPLRFLLANDSPSQHN